MSSERASATSIVDHIVHQLREDIVGGKLPPGTQLVEVDMAAKYGTSRNTVREALHQLGREGLATFVRNKGVAVRQLASRDLRALYAARNTMELHAIEGSYPLRPDLLGKMLAAIETAEHAIEKGNWRQVGTQSLIMHQSIVAHIGSCLLDEFFLTVCAQLRLVFIAESSGQIIQVPDWIRREREIHGLLARDQRKQASDALAAYLEDSERRLTEVLIRQEENA